MFAFFLFRRVELTFSVLVVCCAFRYWNFSTAVLLSSYRVDWVIKDNGMNEIIGRLCCFLRCQCLFGEWFSEFSQWGRILLFSSRAVDSLHMYNARAHCFCWIPASPLAGFSSLLMTVVLSELLLLASAVFLDRLTIPRADSTYLENFRKLRELRQGDIGTW